MKIDLAVNVNGTESTITSIRDMVEFLKYATLFESIVKGSITYDSIKYSVCSLTEVLVLIAQLNIRILSQIKTVEVSFEHSSKEIQKIVLDAIVDIEGLTDRSELDTEFEVLKALKVRNNKVDYFISYKENQLMIRNEDMFERHIFEIDYTNDNFEKSIILNDSQISGLACNVVNNIITNGHISGDLMKCFYRPISLVDCNDFAKKMIIETLYKLNNKEMDSKMKNITCNPGESKFEFEGSTYSVFIHQYQFVLINENLFYTDRESPLSSARIDLTFNDINDFVKDVDYTEECEYAVKGDYLENLRDLEELEELD